MGGTLLTLRPAPLHWTVEFPEELDVAAFMAAPRQDAPSPLYQAGEKRRRESDDDERYQTVYAREEGSIAAPTAGLHFDEDLLRRIGDMGVGIVKITLHVGIGTFFLIKSADVEGHEMHREHYCLSPGALEAVRKTKRSGGRVIAVGTSTVRTLETVCAGEERGGACRLHGPFHLSRL